MHGEVNLEPIETLELLRGLYESNKTRHNTHNMFKGVKGVKGAYETLNIDGRTRLDEMHKTHRIDALDKQT